MQIMDTRVKVKFHCVAAQIEYGVFHPPFISLVNMPSVTHKYAVGARLFCFEPDPSKAKLIYFAKV